MPTFISASPAAWCRAAGSEADSVLVALGAQVHDLAEVEADRAVLDLEVVPAARRERFGETVERLGLDADGERLAALEADRGPFGGLGHQWPSAGWTISVRTPPVAAGCRKATSELRIPRLATSSIMRTPSSLSSASVRLMSSTR